MEKEQEIWKDIEGYEGRYQVSNLGRFRSLDRIEHGHFCHGRLLSPIIDRKNYFNARLSTDGKVKTTGIHRLVAKAFVSGYQPGLVVNHKDEDPTNNRADNLEWVTQHYNQMYGCGMERSAVKRRKPVVKVTEEGEVVATYKSITDAARDNGVTEQAIVRCCKGKCVRVKDHRFMFGDKPEIEPRSKVKFRRYKVRNLPSEEWRDVDGSNGHYLVSNLGRLKNTYLRRGERLMVQHKSKEGHMQVMLRIGGRRIHTGIHRLVAMAFVDGYQPDFVVNHKDENPANNCADNLEWITRSENNRYGHVQEKRNAKHVKPVIQMTLDGKFIREWLSSVEASRAIGKKADTIRVCCKGIRKTCGGYRWKYRNEN